MLRPARVQVMYLTTVHQTITAWPLAISRSRVRALARGTSCRIIVLISRISKAIASTVVVVLYGRSAPAAARDPRRPCEAECQ